MYAMVCTRPEIGNAVGVVNRLIVGIEAVEVRDTVNHGSGVYGGCRSQQGNNLDEGLHPRARNPTGGIPGPLRQSKCHPPCKERGLPLQDQALPKEIPLASGDSLQMQMMKGKDDMVNTQRVVEREIETFN